MAIRRGTSGVDTLLGSTSADSLFGLEAGDRLFGRNGSDRLFGHQGNDRLYGDGGDDWLLGHAGNDQLRGGTGVDSLFGHHGDDRLYGDAGADRLYGHAGDDRLDGGAGDDRLDGHQGQDRLLGRSGDDRLRGHSGADLLIGHRGDDNLGGGGGADRLFAHQGNDRLNGGGGNDFLSGSSGDDRLRGGSGDDVLLGGSGNDQLAGERGANILDGGSGDDTLDPGTDAGNLLYGGAGDDVLVYRHGSVAKVDGGSGFDILRIAGGPATIDLRGAVLVTSVDVSPEGLAAAQAAGAYDNDIDPGSAGGAVIIVTGGDPVFVNNAVSLSPSQLDGGGTIAVGAGDVGVNFVGDPLDGGGLKVEFEAAGTLVIDFDGESLDAFRPPDGYDLLDPVPDDTPVRLAIHAVDGPLTSVLLPASADVDRGSEQALEPILPVVIPPDAPAIEMAGIEQIDLTDGISNTLYLTPELVRGLSNDLLPWIEVTGDAGDVVDAGGGWVWWHPLPFGPAENDDSTTYRHGNAYLTLAGGVDLAGAPPPALGTTATVGSFGAGALQIDLRDAVAGIATLVGDHPGGLLGLNVAAGGDIDGDGHGDLLLGEPIGFPGAVWVLSGNDISPGTQVVQPEPGDGSARLIESFHEGALFGGAPRIVGDLDNDGHDDFALVETIHGQGSPESPWLPDTTASDVHIVFGTDDLGDLPGNTGDLAPPGAITFELQPNTVFTRVGADGIGDVNGDGFDDLLIRARFPDDALELPGHREAVVIYGADDLANSPPNIATLTDEDRGYLLSAGQFSFGAFDTADAAGDFNGDGFGDFLIGSPHAHFVPGGIAHLVFGQAEGTDRKLIADEPAPYVLELTGAQDLDRFGAAVAGIGDINGDGLDDIAISAPWANPNAVNSNLTGSVYVVYGIAGLTGISIDVANMGDLGFRLDGITPGDEFGTSVTAAGDFNGDGYADFAIGATGINRGAEEMNAGAVYVVFGGPERRAGTWSLNELGNGEVVEVLGARTLDRVGNSVTAAGDIDGDGYDDLFLDGGLAPDDVPDGPNWAGNAHVVYGRADIGNGIELHRIEGTAAADALIGSTDAEIIVGGAGDDVIDGGGGNDTVRAAGGDDLIVYHPASSLRVDGGSGVDTLRLDSAGIVLDFDQFAVLENVERIDLTGSGDNALNFELRDILQLPDTAGLFLDEASQQVVIDGDAGDAVSSTDQGWVAAADTVIDGTAYHTWTHADIAIRLFVDEAIDATLS